MEGQRFRKLKVWEKAVDFIESIYRSTAVFPKEEMYGLTNQIKRSAVSIALNIAEGSGTESDKEFNRYLTIALSSAYEVMCGIELAKRLQFIKDDESSELLKNVDEVSAMITGLKKS